MLAYIAFGSNLGDRDRNIDDALDMLNAIERVSVLRVSPWYETVPVGMPEDALPVINGVAKIETAVSAEHLMESLLSIEQQLGRTRTSNHHHEPRTIDLDLLLYGDLTVNKPGLELPHPRIMQRWFVLKPLCDLCPDHKIPNSHLSVSDALAKIETNTDQVFGTIYEPAG